MTEAISPPPWILVDGSSYLYRAFHSLPPLTNAHGEPTGAMYGVMNMLRRLYQDYQPEYMAVVFDAKGKTFRHDWYPDYKANRPPMPDELQQQIEPLHKMIRASGYPLLLEPGVEADDVIGTLAKQIAAAGHKVLISTSDKDLAQLVNPNIQLINTMNNTMLDPAGVRTKFGVAPEQIVDYLTLMGDTSDNIPGVAKVGPKTAARWLQDYGSLDNLLAQADAIKGKVGESLRAAVAQLPLSRRLVTIDCTLPLNLTLENLRRQSPDMAALQALFQHYEFNSWLTELGDIATTDIATTDSTSKAEYELILTQTQLDTWLQYLQQADRFAVDTETTSLDAMQAELVGIALAVAPGKAAYIPLQHRYPGAPQQLELSAVLAQLQPLLEQNAADKIIAQHAKYDRNVFAQYAVKLSAATEDTMLQSYVLNAVGGRHNMDAMAKRYLNVDTITYETIAGSGAKQLGFEQIDCATAVEYAAEDADITLQLYQYLSDKLQQEPKLLNVYRDLEQPISAVLSAMEQRGILLNVKLLRELSQEFASQMQALETEAEALAGRPFNLGSPKQIQAILFDEQKLPVIQKTAKGQASTGEEVLQELAEQGHALPKVIVEHRALSKLKSTYTDKLPEEVNPRTGRVHTSYHQAVVATGRLSSTNPNLQNIPIRSANGRRIREAFIAPEGKKLLAADYSQIELRIMAHLSGDENLLEAFLAGADIHSATAAEVFGVTLNAVTAEQRRAAKAINFGLIYGMSAFGLAKQLNIGRQQAHEYITLYFERYPAVKRYMDNTQQQAREQGYVETLFGRRLYLPNINARNGQQRQYAERTAINAPMQGTAADIIKRAMRSVHDWLIQNQPNSFMLLQVHDELVFEVPENELATVKQGVVECMTQAAKLAIPLEVSVGIGNNWHEAH